MAVSIQYNNGKVSAMYKDSEGNTITEPLSYTRWNLADSQDSISAYSEELGSEVTKAKSSVAGRIASVCDALANLTTNTYQGAKINYEIKLEGV